MGNNEPEKNAIRCIKSTANSIHTRRCFITGEYCSQQTNIQKIRKKLHSKTNDKGEPAPEINAFVVMNFSSISDVVYESKIKPFIEGLNKYLYLDTKSDRIACVSTANLGDLRDSRLVTFSDIKGKILEAAQNPTDFLKNLEKYTHEKVVEQLPNSELGENALITYLRSLDENNELEKLFNDLTWKENGKVEYYHSLIWKPVSKIHVHRADSNPVSNYIICNRICQQMQMADLIIVDVSVESANIFYEFGLATAFHKLILPICFSGSYYKMEYPQKLATAIQNEQAEHATKSPDGKSEMDHMPKKLERHIDCFPWRRKLFEHFGIRRQKDKLLDNADPDIDDVDVVGKLKFPYQYDGVRYLKHQLVTLEQYGFTDVKYNRFPYTEHTETTAGSMPTGKLIYTWLQRSFNCAPANYPNHHIYNTLIVYTLDRIEDKKQAGQCIVNFYNNITKPMWEKHCFCGDRVAILGQPNQVWDDPKDNQKGVGLPYNVSDLIRLGMDQATYEAENKRIKTEDYLNPTLDFTPDPAQTNNVEIQVKSHIRNRAFQLNPDNPIYVTYLKDGIQRNIPKDVVAAIEELDDKASNNEHYFFCLYHVMLDTLRYANEIVVDLSSNSIQSMFWLGAAHGSDIYAVTVRHEKTEQEKPWSGDQSIQKDRTILDISGLWTAIFRRNETANFYKQLELIQLGIDQHARLKLPEIDLETFEDETNKQLYNAPSYFKDKKQNELLTSLRKELESINWEQNDPLKRLYNNFDDPRIKEVRSTFAKKNKAESRALESYYRDRFWRQMHRDNQLHLFLTLYQNPSNITATSSEYVNTLNALIGEPKSMASNWDLEAAAELSQYLSKRKVISRYQIDTLKKDHYYGQDCPKFDRNAASENFIIIGSEPKPLRYECEVEVEAVSLSEYVKKEHIRDIFQYHIEKKENGDSDDKMKCGYRLFKSGRTDTDQTSETYKVQFLSHHCIATDCSKRNECEKESQKITCSSNEVIYQNNDSETIHYLLPAQLLLWREKQQDSSGNYKYHVSLCGTSGPATKALTSLLVDEEQKWGIWGDNPNGLVKDVNEHLLRYLPLNTLQTHVRKSFFDKFMRSIDIQSTEKCEKNCKDKCIKTCHKQCPAHSHSCPKKCWSSNAEWNDTPKLICKDNCEMHREGCANGKRSTCSKELIAQCTHNLQIAKHLSLTYLSTVLPQYFLPFLSHSDEKRIYHGLEAFLRMTGGQDTAMFEEAINQHTSTILDALKEALFQFRGVDALYGVSVSAKTPSSSNTDDRSITDIRLLHKDNDNTTPVINYLYVDDKPG